MNKLGCIRLIVVLAVGLFGRPLFAQTSAEDQARTSVQSPAESPGASGDDAVQAHNDGREQQTQYAVALNGTGLISMDRSLESHLLFGATAMGGWDSNPENIGNGAPSGTYTLSPYFGIQASTPKTQYLLQYQSTIAGYMSSSSKQTMNIGSAKIVGSVNERWSWDLKAAGIYGQDSTRFLAPQQTVAVGEVPGTGPNSASYLPNAGTVTYVDGEAGVHYRKSERNSIAFTVANAFSHYTGLNDKSSIATANLGYVRDLSLTLKLITYGQGSYYYGSFNCESGGGGIGLQWQASDKTFISLSGGPQLSSSVCKSQQKYAYSAALSSRLSGKSQIYLLSARQPTASSLGPGLWQVGASGGYQRQVTRIGTLSVDLGYVSSDTLTTVSSYHGTYFDCIYGFRVGHGVNMSYSYRGYVGATGGANFTRNVATFSLVWAPNVGHTFQ
jgi:hypothetical protein